MPTLAQKFDKAKSTGPVWKGPEEDGITQSLLSLFIGCRERFRIKAIEGLAPPATFSRRLEYGQMWHACEEALAEGTDWGNALRAYCVELSRRFPTSGEQIARWWNVCRVQFPTYVEYWEQHPDVKNRTPLLQEETFDVPYELPSGRTVRLRGKWDSVDLVDGGIWLQENKTKGDFDEQVIKRQLAFDLQTMFYLVALTSVDTCIRCGGPGCYLCHLGEGEYPGSGDFKWEGDFSVKGVRYNVVRRPLSGGLHSITRRVVDDHPGNWQPYLGKRGGMGWKNVHTGRVSYTEDNPGRSESSEEFYERLKTEHLEKDPDYFFARWNVEITPWDIQRFQHACLNPILEQLCDWWGWVNGIGESRHPHAHWRTPYNCFNPSADGRPTDLDEYLRTGSTVGLSRVESLFPELD